MSVHVSLMPDEEPLVLARQHWSVMVPPVAAAVAILAAVSIILRLLPGIVSGHDITTGKVIAGLVLGALVVGWLLTRVARWRLATYLLTDRRIVVEEGVLSRTTESITLDRVQNTVIRRPLGDRLIGAGDIEIESAGRDGVEVLHRIPNAQAFYTALMQAMEALRGGVGAPPHRSF